MLWSFRWAWNGVEGRKLADLECVVLVLRKAADAMVIQVGLVCSVEGSEGRVGLHCRGVLLVLGKAADAVTRL